MKGNPILCVDFDGVIHSYKSGWQGPRTIADKPVPGALEWLRTTYEEGKFDVAIYSSRSKALFGRWAMRSWLRHWLIDEYGYMAGPGLDPLYDEILHWLKFPAKKPAAFLTIDDRAVCFDGNWSALTADAMFRFKPWNKRTRIATEAPPPASSVGEGFMPTEPNTCQCKACTDRPHLSSCSVHREPAYPNGDCNCDE